MPQWHLLLSEEDRWAAIKYLKAMFVNPSEPTDVSDEVPPAYTALDPAPYAPTPETLETGQGDLHAAVHRMPRGEGPG